MKTRHAALIRCGILAARDPELSQYVHLAPRLVREAARREAVRIEDRELKAALTAMYGIPQRVWVGIAPPPVRQPSALLRHMDEIVRRMTPKPIPDTFKAAPTPPEVFTVPAWHKHHAEHAPHTSISEAVARRAKPEQAEHLRRFYA